MASITRTLRRSRLILGAVLLLVSASGSGAQQSAIQRKPLLTQDGPPGYQTLVVALEIAPGGREDKHTHPGPITGYILEGALVLEHEGRPTTTYKAGEAFYVEAGKVHFGINSGSVPVKLVATLVVEKGKPAASPAP
jgi:quercetin dioxygenase-like cupin family protein